MKSTMLLPIALAGVLLSAPVAAQAPARTVIHAGTKRRADGAWTVNGGRVLNLATVAEDLTAARAAVEADLARVGWPGMQVRRDIGLRALLHAEAGKGVQDGW